MECSLIEYSHSEDYDSIAKRIAQFIYLQRNLKHFIFYESNLTKDINEALMYQKDSLRHIEFNNVTFEVENFFVYYCDKLETLSFIGSGNLEKVLKPIIGSPFVLLNTLILCDIQVPLDVLSVLIRSSNRNLEQDGYSFILDLISHYCLNLTELGSKEISSLFLQLKNCRQLKKLENFDIGQELDVNNILPKLSEYLPPRLIELNIKSNWIKKLCAEKYSTLIWKSEQVNK